MYWRCWRPIFKPPAPDFHQGFELKVPTPQGTHSLWGWRKKWDMNYPAKVFLVSLSCSVALAVTRPMKEDAGLTAELIGGAGCESLPRRGWKSV